MNILPSGSSQTFTLNAWDQLTVTSRGGTTVTGPSGLLGTVSGTSTFGGYSVDTEITIAAVMNDCQYGVTEPENALASTNANNTVLVVADNSYPLPKNFLPRVQSVHDIDLAEPLYELDLTSPYDATTATAAGKYEFAYGTPVYCAQGFHGYKFWMVAAPYPTQGVSPALAAYKYENPCILASNDEENWVVPDGLINPIATSIGLADTTSYYADPYIAFNEDFTKLYVIFMHTNQAGTNKTTLYVTESSDGVTWTTPVAIYNSTSLTFTPNSPSLFRTETGWTCLVIDTRDGTGTFTVQKMTTTSATPYTGWTALAAVTCTHPLSRNWWHAHFIPLADGGIIGMAVDNGAGGGAVYTLQSYDGGANFSVRQFSAHRSSAVGGSWYRPSLCVVSDGISQSLVGFFGRIGPIQQAGYYIQKAKLATGATNRAITNAALEDIIHRQVATPANPLALGIQAWDSFNRADDLLTVGTSDSGHAWTNQAAVLGIGTNRLYNPNGAAGAIATFNPALQNFEASIVIETLGAGETFFTFNYQNSSNRYRFGWTGSQAKFQKIKAGSTVIDNTPLITIATGDRLGVRRQGKYITIFHNGRPIDTYYDSEFSQYTPMGFQMFGATSYIGQIYVKPL